MLVMILEKSPASLKGALSRWLIEPRSGVFLGNPSARVREEIWNLAISKCREGSVLQIWSYPCPQGYRYRVYGSPSREMVDFEGMALVRVPNKEDKKPKQAEALLPLDL